MAFWDLYRKRGFWVPRDVPGGMFVRVFEYARGFRNCSEHCLHFSARDIVCCLRDVEADIWDEGAESLGAGVGAFWATVGRRACAAVRAGRDERRRLRRFRL